MYPFAQSDAYLRNGWYVVATADEIAEHPIERTVMDQPVAVFRMAQPRSRRPWHV